ncbi:hypothetical protein NIES39_D00320 [Arthrospira platensis NIES-39]|nr:hypothetical protein NIES39_D00320 [Arthrospira platensis NIES-39]
MGITTELWVLIDRFSPSGQISPLSAGGRRTQNNNLTNARIAGICFDQLIKL